MLRDAQDQQQLMVDHVAEEVRKIVDPQDGEGSWRRPRIPSPRSEARN